MSDKLQDTCGGSNSVLAKPEKSAQAEKNAGSVTPNFQERSELKVEGGTNPDSSGHGVGMCDEAYFFLEFSVYSLFQVQ